MLIRCNVSTLNQFRWVCGMPDYSGDLMMPHTDIADTPIPIISDCDLENATLSWIESHCQSWRHNAPRPNRTKFSGLFDRSQHNASGKRLLQVMAKPYYFPLEATLCLVFPASDHQLWSQCVVCVHGSGRSELTSTQRAQQSRGAPSSEPWLGPRTAHSPPSCRWQNTSSVRT